MPNHQPASSAANRKIIYRSIIGSMPPKKAFATSGTGPCAITPKGFFECEQVFGVTITNSNGKQIPVRYIGEQHVMEDCGGRVPSLADWLSKIQPEPWMARATKTKNANRGAE